jgi:glycosyltransferase involved in cell wall biosynthesis
VTVHGSDLYTNLENPRWRAEITQTVRDARAIICVGSRLARDCIEYLGADAARTLVVPDTYDDTRFSMITRGSHAGPVRLVSVGRLSREKGHDVLVQAASVLAARGVPFSLEIVGDGRERAALEAMIADAALGDRVRLLGALSGVELKRALERADLFVLPSRAEGFGVALIEAMATGLPAVVTRSGGPEDIVHGRNGTLVDPGDADALADGILDVIGSLGRFDSSAIARDTRERYSQSAVGCRLIRVYAEVLAGVRVSGTVAEEDAR